MSIYLMSSMLSSCDITGTLGSITLSGTTIIGTLSNGTIIVTLGGATVGNFLVTTFALSVVGVAVVRCEIVSLTYLWRAIGSLRS